MTAAHGFDPQRFLDAQSPVWTTVMAELRAGRKRSHWMWFVFPQLRALGRSETARHYGLVDRDEACAYGRHPVLGPRLVQAAQALLDGGERDATAIMGRPDDLKLRSCMTLFELACPDEPVFARLLEAFYGGERDPLTLDALGVR